MFENSNTTWEFLENLVLEKLCTRPIYSLLSLHCCCMSQSTLESTITLLAGLVKLESFSKLKLSKLKFYQLRSIRYVR